MTLITQPPYEWSEIRSWLVYLTDRLNSGAGDLTQLTGTIFNIYDQYPNWLYSQKLSDYYHIISSYSTQEPTLLFIKKSARLDTSTTGNVIVGQVVGKYIDSNIEKNGSRISFHTFNDSGNFKSYISLWTRNQTDTDFQQRIILDENGTLKFTTHNNAPAIQFDNKSSVVANNNSMWVQNNELKFKELGQTVSYPALLWKSTTESTNTNTTFITNMYPNISIAKEFMEVGRILKFKLVWNITATNATASNRFLSIGVVFDNMAYDSASFDIGSGFTINNTLVVFEQFFTVLGISGNDYTMGMHGQFVMTANNQIRTILNTTNTVTLNGASIFTVRHRTKWDVALTTNSFVFKLGTLEAY